MTLTRKQEDRFGLILQAAGFTKIQLTMSSDYRLRFPRAEEMKRSRLQILMGHPVRRTFEDRYEYQVATKFNNSVNARIWATIYDNREPLRHLIRRQQVLLHQKQSMFDRCLSMFIIIPADMHGNGSPSY